MCPATRLELESPLTRLEVQDDKTVRICSIVSSRETQRYNLFRFEFITKPNTIPDILFRATRLDVKYRLTTP